MENKGKKSTQTELESYQNYNISFSFKTINICSFIYFNISVMLLNCVAYGCRKRNQKESKPGFFRFANNDPELRQKWINAYKREKREW